MTTKYTYIVTDTPQTEIDLTPNIRIGALNVTINAEEGAVATSNVVIDDPDGTLDLVGLKAFVISETAASGSNTIIGSFALANRVITRGPFRVGAARQWAADIVDINSIAEQRVMVGPGNNRPAETDVQRMQWLMTTSELGQVSDTTFLDTSGPVAMDAVDYNGQKAADIISDCSQASGKNWFIYYREASLVPGLWYGFASSTAYTSSIRLTNVESDIRNDPTGLTVAISDDAELTRDPSRVFSGALVQYDGGSVYEQSASTYNAFRRRDALVPAENVKTQAKATARATGYLGEMSSEDDRITVAILLPADKVNFVKAGMRVQYKATHHPGYEVYNWLRVMQCNVKYNSEQADVAYLVTLVLAQNNPPQLIIPTNPTYTIDLCNTVIENGNRDAQNLSGGSTSSGERWAFVITNNVHDNHSMTNDYFRIIVHDGIERTVYSAVMVPGEQGTGFPTTAWPGRSGTFTVPTLTGPGTFWVKTKSDYTGSGGPAVIDECWRVVLTRL